MQAICALELKNHEFGFNVVGSTFALGFCRAIISLLSLDTGTNIALIKSPSKVKAAVLGTTTNWVTFQKDNRCVRSRRLG